jgi:hypothetical protein
MVFMVTILANFVSKALEQTMLELKPEERKLFIEMFMTDLKENLNMFMEREEAKRWKDSHGS